VKDIKGQDSAPHPSFTLQLSDETFSGSNLLAVQKFFDGKFQFDVFFESQSARTQLSCTS
jgi:mannosyl-oligosaccharide glucosidase